MTERPISADEPPPTDWVRFARWSLGEITDDEYADALVAEGEDEDSLAIQILRRPRESP